MLDNIESNVASVAANAENATGELRRANQYALSSRKRLLCLLSTALIVLLILILLLRPWKTF
jgi:t-SNARE complex subunit (syntaxin)